MVLFLLVVAVAITGAVLSGGLSIYKVNPTVQAKPPSGAYPLGTDGYGRSLVEIVPVAIYTDLYVGLIAATVSVLIGIAIGALAGIYKGNVDEALMRFVDIFLSLPALVLALAVAAALGHTINDLMIALIVADWPIVTRLVRNEVLSEMAKPYVSLLRTMGVSRIRILAFHVIRNIRFFLTSITALHIAFIITFLSALEYLGFSYGSLTPELGALISQGQTYFLSDPWLMLFPSACLVVMISAFVLISHGIQNIGEVRVR